MYTHLSELKKIYGQQSLVNLVNMKGHEKPIKEAYERHIVEVRSVPRNRLQPDIL